MYLARLPKKYEQRFSPNLKVLYCAYHLSIKLAECGAFIPQLLELKKKQNVIRWIPAVINEEVNTLVDLLKQSVSSDIVKVQVNATKQKYLSLYEQSITLVSLFLTHYMKAVTTVPIKSTSDTESKIDQLFFNNQIHSFAQFSENQIPEAIYQYLQRFYLSDKLYVPLIKIEDNAEQNTFDLQLWVENRKDSMQEPLPLHNFIENKIYRKFNALLFQSLASLSRDFPAIKPLISSSGAEQLMFNADSFAEVLLQILPLVKLLGIRVLLPNSLKSLARPKASLKLDRKQSDPTAQKIFRSQK